MTKRSEHVELREVPVDDIIVGDRFREDMGDLLELANSILSKGLIQPITLTPGLELLAGGRRYFAAQKAGLKTIPAVIRPVDDELDMREVELFENIYRKDLTWQERAALERRIYELKRDKLGWGQRQTAELLDESLGALNKHLQLARATDMFPHLSEYKTEDDAWKAYKKIQEALIVRELEKRAEAEAAGGDSSPLAEAWRYADNHYKIGDALEGLVELQSHVWDLAEVDPPYGIDLDTQKRQYSGVSTMGKYQEVPSREYGDFIRAVAKEVHRVLKQQAFCVWWFGPTHYTLVFKALTEAGFTVADIPAIWYKGGTGQTNAPDINLANSYEPFFICRKGSPALRKPGRSNVFHFPPVTPTQKIHPTERPIELMDEILDTFCWPRTGVIVPFLGSGVTLRALYKRNQVGFGWDLSEDVKKKFLLKLESDLKGRGVPRDDNGSEEPDTES